MLMKFKLKFTIPDRNFQVLLILFISKAFDVLLVRASKIILIIFLAIIL